MEPRFEDAIDVHDADVARVATEIWVGAEPTFTLPTSEAREWLSEALGGDKQVYALRMLEALRRRRPGSLVLRSVGRQYAAEERPRWSVGLLERRDGRALWGGPPDPLTQPCAPLEADGLDRLWVALEQTFANRGWGCRRFLVPDEFGRRLLVCREGDALDRLREDDPRLGRSSVHARKTPPEGLSDPLAAEGVLLFAIGAAEAAPAATSTCIELPAFARVGEFLDCTDALSEAARETGLAALVLQGFPPPVDDTLAWTTVTPDPAVLEVNQAPQPDVGRFLGAMRELFAVARQLGLSPYRLQYNGTVSDSGGGGQFTLGGRSADASPFLRVRALLPRLIRYFNHHPALAYLFAPDYVGGASQSPRPDEGTRDAFHELGVALEQLERAPEPTPEFLWASLAPFLADPSGNAHRSELNIEKLWNPYLPGRGRLGLVEFRAFRMPGSPERASAIAALLRAIAAMLTCADPAPRLRDWGDELHDRYALPWFLRQDLRSVFGDLAASGFGLPGEVQAVLLEDPARSRWSAAFAGCELALEHAVEFWPLVGDVASQEGGGSRLVDSSTARLQVSLRRLAGDGPGLAGWQLEVAGCAVPLRDARDGLEEVRLIGLRYRDFTPWRGLHPGIRPYGPLTLRLLHPELEEALEATLHGWRPDALPYAGLPEDLEVAAARRAERFVSHPIRRPREAPAALPPRAVRAYTVDLRRL